MLPITRLFERHRRWYEPGTLERFRAWFDQGFFNDPTLPYLSVSSGVPKTIACAGLGANASAPTKAATDTTRLRTVRSCMSWLLEDVVMWSSPPARATVGRLSPAVNLPW